MVAASLGYQRYFVNVKYQLTSVLIVTGLTLLGSRYHNHLMEQRGRFQKDLDEDLKKWFLAGRVGMKDYAGHVQADNTFILEKADKADFEDRSSHAGKFAHVIKRTVLGDKLQRRTLESEEEEWLRSDDQKNLEENAMTTEESQRIQLKWEWYDSNSPLLMETYIFNKMKSL